MGDELVVDTGAMRSHATKVSGIAGSFGEAADASATSAMPDMAFGLLCSFLLPPATLLQGMAVAAVSTSAGAMSVVGRSISASAEAYDRVDEATNEGLTTLLRVLQ